MLIPTILIGLGVAVTMTAALVKYRDTFHPAMLIGPMLAFHYCYSPLMLLANDGFDGFLWDAQVELAQWIHLTGVLALCFGLYWGSTPRRASVQPVAGASAFFDRARLVQGSILLGGLGIASFVYGINYVGGFSAAYGNAYGGGGGESGWVRDVAILTLPALLLLAVSHEGRFGWRVLALALVFASPFLIHGLLGARRGPTFIGLVGPTMLFYMARGKRPSLPALALGGAILGTLMLTLVANRNSVYWGAELELKGSPNDYFRPSPGQDFVYGAGLVIVADELQNFSWGTSYLVTLFVRPIPRALWPSKYEDAAQFFDRPSLEENLGVDIKSFQNVLGWTAAHGAAPGIVGDMWREFSWGMLVALLGIGWFYGYAWRRAITNHGYWVPTYCFLASLSLYMVMQTLEALLSRFLFGVVPMLLAMKYARRGAAQPAQTDGAIPCRHNSFDPSLARPHRG
jgi:hypothetical protein